MIGDPEMDREEANVELKTVPLKEIDLADGTFRVRRIVVSDGLLVSVERNGVVNPPWLQRRESGGYRVVLGFRRISALEWLGRETVRANVVTEADHDDKGLLEIAILENLSHGPFDPVEVSRALAGLRRMEVPDEEILRRFMPMMGLKGDGTVLDSYLYLTRLPEDILESVSIGEIRPSTIDRIQRSFEGTDRDRLLRLVRDLKLGVNRQRELIALLDELVKREGAGLSGILDTGPISGILEDDNRNVPQKAQALISRLRERRFPLASEMMKGIRERIRELGLGQSVSLEVSPYLEERMMRLSFGFATPEEYREVLDRLTAVGDAGDISRILADFFGEGGMERRKPDSG